MIDRYKIEYGHITGERKNGHDVGVKYKIIIGKKSAEKFLKKLNESKDPNIEYITLHKWINGKWEVLG
jgi:hypothetical protein